MLTGTYKSRHDFAEDDWRRNAPRFSDENFPKNLELVEKLSAIGKAKGCTPSQLTLAWLMKQGEDIIPIPGTKRVKNLEENMGALDVVLSEEEEKEIRREVERAEIKGDRYDGVMKGVTFMDTPPLESQA